MAGGLVGGRIFLSFGRLLLPPLSVIPVSFNFSLPTLGMFGPVRMSPTFTVFRSTGGSSVEKPEVERPELEIKRPEKIEKVEKIEVEKKVKEPRKNQSAIR